MTESKICNCGKEATKGITFAGEIISYICDECAKERDKKLEEIRNSHEQIAFRKTYKEMIEVNKRIICKVGGCSEYCGENHIHSEEPFVEGK